MNIRDSRDLNLDVKEDAFSFLYKKQYELYEKYKDIEEMPDEYPLNIHGKEAQIWVKDFFWRVTEELMEGFEAIVKCDYDHYLEELSDALHFYLEIFVLLGYDEFKIDPLLSERQDFYDFDSYRRNEFIDKVKIKMHTTVYYMGLAANCLRNKKWKQSQVLVDEQKFKDYLETGLMFLIELILTAFKPGGEYKKDILNIYFKKFQVNQFRQRSKY